MELAGLGLGNHETSPKTESYMKSFLRPLAGIGIAAWITLGTAIAQDGANPTPPAGGPPGGGPGGGRNWDPAQMRQRMMENYREQLGVKDDEEWKLIQTRIEKVTEARMAVGFRGGFGGRRGGGPGGGPGGAPGGPGGGGRRGFGEPSPEADALQKVIEANGSADEIKTKLAAYRASTKEKEAKLEAAQEDLKKVLSVKQEAAAVLAGLLK